MSKAIYKGIDVSEWQGAIDWAKVKASGIQFVIPRAGYGQNNIDARWKEYAKGASAAGLYLGAYWFSYAYTVDMARSEADYLCNAVEAAGIKPMFPLYFDFEYDSYNYAKKHGVTLNSIALARIADAFLARVEERGYYAGNYTNPDFLNRGFSGLTDRFDTWLAQWGVSAPTTECGVWQYSSKGKIPGIDGNVDMDYAYVDYPALIKRGTKPEPEPDENCVVTLRVIQKGDEGTAVQCWQMLLNGWGYDCGDPDGIFGAKTEAATIKFEGDYNLPKNSIVDAANWGIMLA